MRLVEEICMLDHLGQGRFQLGIGRGISLHELGHFGIAHPEVRQIYDEALEVILKALTSEVLNHKGPRFRYTNFPMELRPLHPPPTTRCGTVPAPRNRRNGRPG